jgi:hypothetical protein
MATQVVSAAPPSSTMTPEAILIFLKVQRPAGFRLRIGLGLTAAAMAGQVEDTFFPAA